MAAPSNPVEEAPGTGPGSMDSSVPADPNDVQEEEVLEASITGWQDTATADYMPPLAVTSMAIGAGPPLLETIPLAPTGASFPMLGADVPVLLVNATAESGFPAAQLWAVVEQGGDKSAQCGVCNGGGGGGEEAAPSSGTTKQVGDLSVPAVLDDNKGPLLDLGLPQPLSVGHISWTEPHAESTAIPAGLPGAPVDVEAQAVTNVAYLSKVRDQLFDTWNGISGFQDVYGFVIDRRKD